MYELKVVEIVGVYSCCRFRLLVIASTIDKVRNHRRCLGEGFRMAAGRIEVKSPQAMRYEMAEELKRIAGNVRPNTYYSGI